MLSLAYRTPQERKKIYLDLSKTTDEAVQGKGMDRYPYKFTCIKLWLAAGNAFGDWFEGGNKIIFDMFPEFSQAFAKYKRAPGVIVLEHDKRKPALEHAASLC